MMKVSLKFLSLVMLLFIAVACGDANDGDGTSDPFDPNAYFDDASPADGSGAPVKECVTDLQCTGGQLCVAGKCFTPSDKKPGDSDKKKECVINYDCSAGEKCSDGICKTSSSSDSGSGGSGKSKEKSKEKTKDDGDDGDDGGNNGDGGGDVTGSCTNHQECKDFYETEYAICVKGSCMQYPEEWACSTDQDCNSGLYCHPTEKICKAKLSVQYTPVVKEKDKSYDAIVYPEQPDTATFKNGNSYFMVFGKNASGKLATVYRDAEAETWNGPTPLESTANTSSNSSAVFNGANGNIEVFARDSKDDDSTNSKILHWYFSAKTRTWSKGAALKGKYNARGNPTAVYNPAYKAIEVFAKNDVGELLYWYWTADSDWSTVQIVSVANRIHEKTSPTAFYYPQHRNTHVFARSPDNRLYHWRRGNNVHPEQTDDTDSDDFLAASGQIGNQPSVTFQGAHGGIWISAVTTDKKISLLVYDLNSGSWYTLATLGSGTNAVGRTAIVYNPKTTDVEIFATGTDNDIYRWYWDSTKGIENGHQKMIGHATKRDVVAAFDHHLGAIRVFVHGDGDTFKQLVADPSNPNTFKHDQSIALAQEPSVMVYPPLEASRYHGGDGGGRFSILCPKDSIAIGLRAKNGEDVDQIGLVCKDLATDTVYTTQLSNGEDGGEERICPDGTNGEQGILINALSEGDSFDSYGDDPDQIAKDILFGPLGVDWNYEPLIWIIRGLNGQCGFLDDSNDSDADGVAISVGDYLGNYGGLDSVHSSDVPEGAVITGIQGASGDRLDRFNFLYKIIDVTKP